MESTVIGGALVALVSFVVMYGGMIVLSWAIPTLLLTIFLEEE